MGRASSHVTHNKVKNACTEYEDIRLQRCCFWEQKQSSPEEEVSVSMTTAKEQPRFSECGRGVLAPLLLPESQHKRSINASRQLDQMEEDESSLTVEAKEE